MNPWASALVGYRNISSETYKSVRRDGYRTVIKEIDTAQWFANSMFEDDSSCQDRGYGICKDIFTTEEEITDYLLRRPANHDRGFDAIAENIHFVRVRVFDDSAPLATATAEWRENVNAGSKRIGAETKRVRKLAEAVFKRGGRLVIFGIGWERIPG